MRVGNVAIRRGSRKLLPGILKLSFRLSISVLCVVAHPASAQRWAEPAPATEEASLAQTLIAAIRSERWLDAMEIADRYRGSQTSSFSQFQAFAYMMTGRLDLVSELQREGRIPSANICDDPSGRTYRDAVETIIKAAEHHRAVVIQEFHWNAQHRFLLHALLPRLRAMGFTDFAAEDFEGDPEEYRTARYPQDAPGFHSTREPVFADAVRVAIALGYKLTPYEAAFPPPPEVERKDFQSYRSNQQAENLYERIFAHDSSSRAIIYTGVGWAREAADPKFPDFVPMLTHLRELSGIDPLTVDQTTCRQPESRANGTPVVAFDSAGNPVVRGVSSGAFDLQVRYAPVAYEDPGRAEWLYRLGRKPVPIPDALRPENRPFIAEAHLQSEPDDASPVDRIYLGATESLPLMLPAGRFRISVQPREAEPVIVVVE